MKNYIESIAERLDDEDPDVLIWEVDEAFAEASGALTPRTEELRELVRFCNFDALAPWLRYERDAVQRALRFARKIGENRVGDILEAALDGKPQGKISFSVTLPGQQHKPFEVDAGEVTKFGGIDWGDTDIALSFAMDGFISAVLHELVASADDFDLPPPRAVKQRTQVDAKIEAQIAGGETAAELFRKLVGAKNPRMEVGEWEDFETRSNVHATTVPLKHLVNPPAAPAALAQIEKKYGAVAREIVEVFAEHNGAELFMHNDECGFCVAPVEHWEKLLREAIEWAEDVTWQDDRDDIPPYLYSAIAFGFIPGDSERWLFITEGEHAGKVMLSDTDLTDDHPRFDSLAHFFAMLLTDAPRVLNSGGYVRYHIGNEELFPIAYRAD